MLEYSKNPRVRKRILDGIPEISSTLISGVRLYAPAKYGVCFISACGEVRLGSISQWAVGVCGHKPGKPRFGTPGDSAQARSFLNKGDAWRQVL
jgi:hypothetical protein